MGRFILFLLLNFGALYLGALFMGSSPVENEWYQALNKAPWTPPGWVFGAAWTTIMICYAVYMSHVWKFNQNATRKVMASYLIQLFLNIIWNPLFFNWKMPWIALFCLLILMLLITWQLFLIPTKTIYQRLLIAPYFLWLIIALSLNFFVVLNN